MDIFDRYIDLPRRVAGGRVAPRWEEGERFVYSDRDRWHRVSLDDGNVVTKEEASPPRRVPFVDAPPHRVSPDGRACLTRHGTSVGGDFNVGLREHEEASGKQLSYDGDLFLRWEIPNRAWSPDSKRAVLIRTDYTRVHRLPVVTWEAMEHVDYVPYSKAGTPGADRTVFLVERRDRSLVETSVRSRNGDFLWATGWRSGGDYAYLLHLSRNARDLRLVELDARSNQSRTIVPETSDDGFVVGLDWPQWYCQPDGGHPWEPRTQLTVLEAHRRLLWLSERDGYRHIYMYDFDGKLIRQLTDGTAPVEFVEAVDEENSWVYFSALDSGCPYQKHLYRCNFEGHERQRLTEAPGHHDVAVSPSRKYFIDNHSSPARPPVSELRSTSGRQLLVLSESDVSALEDLGWQPPELFKAKAADGATDLHGILYRPANFRPDKSYPVIDYVYAGPFTRTVPSTFHPSMFLPTHAQALAQLGFLVVVIDGRGTPGRGKAFHGFTYGRIGQYEIRDHTAVLRAMARERQYIDSDHQGIIGHSWGGYFALHAMLTEPDFFKVGVASAPGELTEFAFVNEPYMDLPQANPAGYEKGVNADLAKNLKGRLLLIHGTSDVNAPLSTTVRMVKALVEAGKRYDLLLLPGEDHDFRTQHRYRLNVINRYFIDHLRPAHAG